MSKPTMSQHYHLGLYRLMRAFGLVFAIGSVLAIASNIPGLLHGDLLGLAAPRGQILPILLAAAIGFPAIGVLLFIISGRALDQYRAHIDAQTEMAACRMCGRSLNVETDLLSGDCGGDCWGCIGSIEADMGWEPSVESVALEIEAGLRNNDGKAKPYPP